MSRPLLLIAAGLLVGCDDGPVTAPGEVASRTIALAPVSGDGQVGLPGKLLDEFLVFRVIDPAGRPVAGLRVEWEVVAGGGQVSGKRHETDLEGLAAGNFTLGSRPGEHVARAVVRDSLTIDFTARAIEPGPDFPPP